MIELPENPFYRDGAAKGYAQCQKEMLRWLVVWGDEDCRGEDHWGTIYSPPKKKHRCLDCWQELKELAELESNPT